MFTSSSQVERARAQRGLPLLVAAAVALPLALLALLVAPRLVPRPPLSGTVFNEVRAAPEFALPDHRGQLVSLADQRGKAVILTFLYTSCPDICQLTAAKLRRVQDLLGGEAARLTILAVSTDPERDTPEAAQRFSQRFGLEHGWHFLLGTAPQLAAVWSAYHVDAEPAPAEGAALLPAGSVLHSDAVFLIDPQGRQRSLQGSEFDPAALARDVRTLLSE